MIDDQILKLFALPDDDYSLSPYGSGHINRTYLAEGKRFRFVLQRINDKIFPDVEGLMRNLSSVCDYYADAIRKEGGDASSCLTIVPAKDGSRFVKTDEGYYRVYNFIEHTVALNMPLSAEHFGKGGECFARFAKNLAGFDASALTDVIPHFHDTVRRVGNLKNAVKADAFGRKEEVKALIDFVLERESAAGVVLKGLENGLIPLRVTHNDTKFNNLLFDADTKLPVAVIDLDTVMKGSMLYDFGDAVRTGCNSADEDEPDLDKVRFLKDYYDAFEGAYLGVLEGGITAEEKRLLGFSAMLMTYECGVRFLTDYLEGDVYFAVHKPKHNLLRARTQFRLVVEMEKTFGKMTDYAEAE
ncbi:MAG: phosphotransferase enzyme family protein [Candidatus Neoclostridium sp.]